MNLAKATKMYFNYRRWRIVYGVNHLRSFPQSPFEPATQSVIGASYHKFDKHGRPVYLQRTGLIDSASFAKEKLTIVTVGHTWFCEELQRRCELSSRLTGKRVTQSVHVLDISHIGLGATRLRDIFATTTFIDQNCYPESLATLYIINSPAYFASKFSICRVFLSKETQGKIRILGSDFAAQLVEEVGAECLPVEYGGLCKCPGECVPFATREGFVVPTRAETDVVEQSITISAGGVQRIDIVVPAMEVALAAAAAALEASSVAGIAQSHLEDGHVDESESPAVAEPQEVSWSFSLASKDIDYSVEFRPSRITGVASADMVLTPVARTSEPTIGAHQSLVGGVLTIIFDNSYSRWTSKTVQLKTCQRAALYSEN
jgi:hypothetical protein